VASGEGATGQFCDKRAAARGEAPTRRTPDGGALEGTEDGVGVAVHWQELGAAVRERRA